MFTKEIDTQEPINDLIANRWSGRAYDPERPVEKQYIIALLEAARWAPSCYGEQPWRYLICNKTTNAHAWQHAYSCLTEGNQTWAKHAPVLILALANTIFSSHESANRWAQYDTGAASMNLCTQATALGLMVHQMGGFSIDKAMELFSIPEQFIPMAIMTVGFQLPKAQITGDMAARELSERRRNPLQTHFFDGQWDKPIS